MHRIQFVAAPLLALASSMACAQQVVLDFEDLTGRLAPMPIPYGGIAHWGSFAHSDTPDPNYPPASGATYTLSVGLPISIVFGADYIFDGASFAGNNLPWWVKFELYYKGNLVHTSEPLYPALTHAFLDSRYTGLVDEVLVTSEFANFYCMDDFTYTIPGAACYADCDTSTGAGVLDIFDFLCFQDSFVNGETYACDCDTSTGNGVCDIFDFLCFQDAFVAGCP